jgi:hypothetical protein
MPLDVMIVMHLAPRKRCSHETRIGDLDPVGTCMLADGYVHRTTHQMSVPPWFCYCYSLAKANVIPGKVTYPMDMQLTWEQGLSKLETYTALPDTCSGNCGFGTGEGVSVDVGVPPATPPPQPAPECEQLAELGGCEGFCKGKADDAGMPDQAQECIDNCLGKFYCHR